MSKYCIFLFSFFFFIQTQSVFAKTPSWFLSKNDNDQKWAAVPIYSRNSTYGHIFRGRFFIYPTQDTGYYTGLGLALSEELFFSATAFYEYWKENGDELHFYFSYDGFHDPYYGEGDHTKVSDLQYIPSHKFDVQAEYLLHIESKFYSGIFTRFYHRREKDLDSMKFPKETSFLPGLFIRYDSRNSRFNPVSGEFYELRSWVEAPFLSPLFLEGDMRLFLSLFYPKLVLAARLVGGLTFFDKATYSFRFNLGGRNTLRGFWMNRFRGEKYYLSQIELRYMPVSLLTFSAFFDFGSVTDDSFSFPPRYSYGGGVLIGLPPDYDKKLRFELGVGEDQLNFVVSFNHAF